MTPQKVNLAEAFGRFSDHWNPRIGGEVNDTHIRLVKFAGKFDWHQHEAEDEMFLVIAGTMRMGLRTGDIDVHAGEYLIVPKGTEHCPEAVGGECHIMLIEPAATRNTGNVVTEKTKFELARL